MRSSGNVCGQRSTCIVFGGAPASSCFTPPPCVQHSLNFTDGCINMVLVVGSFASRVADGILVATLPFALLTWLSETPSALIAYGLALVGYLVIGECHSLGELANLPSWLAYLVVLVMLFRLPTEKKYLIAALLFGSGAAFLLLATAASFSKLTWCVSGFDNTALGHILTGFALFFLALAIPTPLPANNIELLIY